MMESARFLPYKLVQCVMNSNDYRLGYVLTIEDDPMRVARPINLTPEEQSILEQHSRARSLPARVVERARIVLRAASGLENQQIAEEFGITPEKVARWRNRFLDGGCAALEKRVGRGSEE